MNKLAGSAASLWLVLTLAACGGGDVPGHAPTLQSARQAGAPAAAPLPAAAYTSLIQSIYVAYFGRPADPGGLVYWSEQYRNAGAPTNIVDLQAAYNTVPAIQSLVDVFGTSQESRDLYPGDNSAFIRAIYQNIFSREPEPAGLDYWVALLDRQALTRTGAALTIMSAARESDATIVAHKVNVATSFTVQLDSSERVKGYDGLAANLMVRNMLNRVGVATDSDTFQPSIVATIQALAARPANNARTFSGTVAIGRPVANAAIGIEDLDGAYAEATTDALGGYIIDMGAFVRLGKSVSKLTAPFFVRARYVEDGQAKELHSVSNDPTTGPVSANVTPMTDIVARSYAWPTTLDGRSPQTGAMPLGVGSDPARLERIKSNVKTMYGELAAGVGDPIRDRFVPDPNTSPMDALLERSRAVVKGSEVDLSDKAGNLMARVTLARLSGSSMPSGDAETVTSTEAKAAADNRGAFADITFPLQSGASGVVEQVSPAAVNFQEPSIFTVSGRGLSSTTVFNLSGCENIAELSGGSSLTRRYSCTPQAAGPQIGYIRTGPGGATMYTFHVAVKKLLPPVIFSFGPSAADLGSEAIFRIRGTDLTSGMRFVLNGCYPAREVDSGDINGVSSSMREFACTPTIAGTQTAQIFDQGGTKLVGSFAVQILSKGSKPVITQYSPTTALLYDWIQLTFTGTDLPAGMVVDLGGCIGMTEQGGSKTERRFSCTTTSAGTMNGTVKDATTGALLKSFTVVVSTKPVAPPEVNTFSPGEATQNQSTVFTFNGTDLVSGMGFSLSGCINVKELPGGSSTQRQFSCTPTAAGVKNGTINGQSFSVTVNAASDTDPGGSSALSCFNALIGTWTNSIVGGTWTFTAPNRAKIVLDALNYGDMAQQITEMTLTSCTSTSMSYKITRAALVNSVDPSFAYDKTASNDPGAYDWSKINTQPYTVSGNSFNTGGYTYTRGNGSATGNTGKVAFWSRRTTGTILINIDGVNVGTINSYYTSQPECNGSGTVTRELSAGSHIFKGTTQGGTYGPVSFTIKADSCLLYELN